MSASDHLDEWLNAACEAARRGAAVLESWRHKFQVKEKGRFDLVTEADLAAQQAVFSYLAGLFPDHAFLGEEEGAGANRPGPDSPPTWIVDPLDGTTNYVHGCPLYCVSIGLQVAGELLVGVVLDPTRDELFKAATGRGAWLNERPIQCSTVDRLEGALLSTGFPPDLRGQDTTLAWWEFFAGRAQSLRRTGTTAINMAYVAAGRFDGFWAFDNHVWDVAGGTVLIREAGGVVTNADGSRYDPHTPDVLACNSLLHPVMLAAMAEHRPERRTTV